MTAVFAGIDVAKAHLDVAISGEKTSERFSNDDDGIAKITEQLRGRGVSLVVLEATGGYQRKLLADLLAAGIPAAAVNPRQVRDFAKALGKLEKTDQVDAQVLALFAERIRPETRPAIDADTQEFQDLLARRRQLTEMLVAEKNRLHQAETKLVRRSIEKHVDWLKKQLRDTNKDLENRLRDCPAWNPRVELLESVKGYPFGQARS